MPERAIGWRQATIARTSSMALATHQPRPSLGTTINGAVSTVTARLSLELLLGDARHPERHGARLDEMRSWGAALLRAEAAEAALRGADQ